MSTLFCASCGALIEGSDPQCVGCGAPRPRISRPGPRARREAEQLLDKARSHSMAGRLEVAQGFLREALTTDPTFPAAAELLGEVRASLVRRREAERWMVQGDGHLGEEEFDQAIAAYREALKQRIRPGEVLRKVRQAEAAQADRDRRRTLLDRATADFQAGRFADAETLLREVLLLDPENDTARDLAARCREAAVDARRLRRMADEARSFLSRGRPREAAEHYRKLLEQDPRAEDAQVALDELEKLESARGRRDQERRAEDLATQGFRLLETQPARAHTLAREALEIDPACTNARLLATRSERLLDQGVQQEGLRARAEEAYEQGRLEEAIGLWEQLLRAGADSRRELQVRIQTARNLAGRVEEHTLGAPSPPAGEAPSARATPPQAAASSPALPRASGADPLRHSPPVPPTAPPTSDREKRRWGLVLMVLAALLALILGILWIAGDAIRL